MGHDSLLRTQLDQLLSGVLPERGGVEAVELDPVGRVRGLFAGEEDFEAGEEDPARDGAVRVGDLQDGDLLHAVVQERQRPLRHLAEEKYDDEAKAKLSFTGSGSKLYESVILTSPCFGDRNRNLTHLPRLSDLEQHRALPGEEVVPHVEQRGRLLEDGVAENVVDVRAQDQAAPVRVPSWQGLQPFRHD